MTLIMNPLDYSTAMLSNRIYNEPGSSGWTKCRWPSRLDIARFFPRPLTRFYTPTPDQETRIWRHPWERLTMNRRFPQDRTHKVLVDGEATKTSGHIWSPTENSHGAITLLAVHRDSQERITSKVRLVVDDCLLYRTIRKKENCHVPRLMNFNLDKCEVLRNKKNPVPADYMIHGTALAFVKSAKYLGLNPVPTFHRITTQTSSQRRPILSQPPVTETSRLNLRTVRPNATQH